MNKYLTTLVSIEHPRFSYLGHPLFCAFSVCIIFWSSHCIGGYITVYTQPTPLHLPHLMGFVHIQLWPIFWVSPLFNKYLIIFTLFYLHRTTFWTAQLNPQLPSWLVDGWCPAPWRNGIQQHPSRTPRLLLPAPLVHHPLLPFGSRNTCVTPNLLAWLFNCFTPRMETLQSFETSWTACRMTHCNIPEDLNLQLLYCVALNIPQTPNRKMQGLQCGVWLNGYNFHFIGWEHGVKFFPVDKLSWGVSWFMQQIVG
jgi:hypothetical protein